MSANLDFDYLSNLAQTNPEKFEEIRAQEIEKLIQNASSKSQQRLRGLQFQIDAKRHIHKDSQMGTCMAISKMMRESFENLRYHLNHHFNAQSILGNPTNSELETEQVQAQVLQFRR